MPLLLLIAAWISGAAALAAETLWFRALGRGVGTSAEALAVVSASFLGGLGIGAAIASRRAPRSPSPLRTAAICEVIAGVLVALSPFALAIVPDAHLGLLHALSLRPGPSAWPAALVALPILALPAAFLGATLPFLVRGTVERVERAGRWTGLLYGVNTIGAACGTWLAAWLLLPSFGESLSLRLAGAGNLLAALLLLSADAVAAARREAKENEALADAVPQDEVPAASTSPHGEAAAESRPAIVAPAARDESAGLSSQDPQPSLAAPGVVPLAPLSPSRTPREEQRARVAAGLALFVSGFLALGAEIAWFRLLEPITGVHIYGFALLLVGVLVGTAAGAACGGLPADRVRRPDLGLAVVLSLAGVLTVLSIAVAGYAPTLALRAASDAAEAARAAGDAASAITAAGGEAMFRGRIVAALLTVIPPLFAFAAAYPLAVRARSRSAAGAAGEAGSVYAWNTAGNVVGSLLAGFVLLPRLGSAATLLLLGGLGIAAGAALWLSASRPRPAVVGALLVLPLAMLALPGSVERAKDAAPSLPEVVCLSKWSERYRVRSRDDVRVLAATIAGTYPTRDDDPEGRPILPKDGVVSQVGLLLEKGSIRLRQGGLSESKIVPNRTDDGTETETALGLLPWLAHPGAKTALVIGHGAGWTVETVLAEPLEHVDVAELEPAVLDRVETVRGRLAVRDARNATLHIADGRLLLREAAARAERDRYDLIVSQPSHPWVPGAGHLFTREAYLLARSALRDDGVFAQWLNIFDMSEGLFRTAMESWRQAFPTCWVFVYDTELVLVGFRGAPKIDPERWRRAIEREPVGVRARAAGIAGPEDLLRKLMLDEKTLARFLSTKAEPATDDEPRLETGLAWMSFRGQSRDQESIKKALRAEFPPDFAAAIPDLATRDAFLESTALRAVEVSSSSDEAADAAKRWTSTKMTYEGGVAGRRAHARRWLANAREGGSQEEKRAWRAEGMRYLNEAAARAPDDPDIAREIVRSLVDVGSAAEAVRRGDAFAERFQDDGPLLAEWARALMTVSDSKGALAAFARAMAAKTPPPVGTGLRYARAILARNDSATPADEAEARDVLRHDPAVASDLDSLREESRLEIKTSTSADPTPEAKAAAKQLEDAERARAVSRLATAKTYMNSYWSGDGDRGLEAAQAATRGLPGSSDAWRTLAWFQFRDATTLSRGGDAESAERRFGEAEESLRQAIRHAGDADEERTTARGYLRIFRRDPAALDRAASTK